MTMKEVADIFMDDDMNHAQNKQLVSESMILHETVTATISTHDLPLASLGKKTTKLQNKFAKLCHAVRFESTDFQIVRQLPKRLLLFVSDGGEKKIRRCKAHSSELSLGGIGANETSLPNQMRAWHCPCRMDMRSNMQRLI